MNEPVDPATLGDGPFLLVSEGNHGGYRRVFVDVIRGSADVGSITRILSSHWDWPEGQELDGLPHWHRMDRHLLWSTRGRSPWDIRLAPTTPRVAEFVEGLVRQAQPNDFRIVLLASWSDEQVDRLAPLLQQVGRTFSADLTVPPWLMSFDDGDEAGAYMREIEYELGEWTLPQGEVSFGPGPWLVYSVGYQGDVHEADLIWGEAHRYSIAGSIRRNWGTEDEILELRGQWWDVEDDGRIDVILGGDPFGVALVKVSPAVAGAIAAYEPYHCCSASVFDLPQWSDDQARRFADALQTLTMPASSFVRASVLNHAPHLYRPDQLSEALEVFADPSEHVIDAGCVADLAGIWADVVEVLGATGARHVLIEGSRVAVQLAGADGPPEYGCRSVGRFSVLWYRHERRDRGRFPLDAVSPADLADFVATPTETDCRVSRIEISAVSDDHASLTETYDKGQGTTMRRSRIELSSGRIVPVTL